LFAGFRSAASTRCRAVHVAPLRARDQVIGRTTPSAGTCNLIVDGRVAHPRVRRRRPRSAVHAGLHEGSIVATSPRWTGLRTTDAHASTRVLSASLSSAEFKQLLREEPLVEQRYVRYLVGLCVPHDRVIELSTLAVQNRNRAEVLRQGACAPRPTATSPGWSRRRGTRTWRQQVWHHARAGHARAVRRHAPGAAAEDEPA
jgi:hypothetical protein